MRAKAIIFDWDGVIADTLPVNFQIYRVIEKKIGKKIFADDATGDDWELDWHGHFKKANIHDEKTYKKAELIYYEEMARLDKQITLFPGIKEVLKQLSKKYKLAIVSNTGSKVVKKKLGDFEIKDYFTAVIGGEFHTIKPDPGQIHECMRKLNVKPEETIYIGDMDGDVLAGRNAKVKLVAAVTYGWHSEKRLKNLNPDIVFHSPEELMELAKY